MCGGQLARVVYGFLCSRLGRARSLADAFDLQQPPLALSGVWSGFSASTGHCCGSLREPSLSRRTSALAAATACDPLVLVRPQCYSLVGLFELPANSGPSSASISSSEILWSISKSAIDSGSEAGRCGDSLSSRSSLIR